MFTQGTKFQRIWNARIAKSCCKGSKGVCEDYLGWENMFTVRVDEQTFCLSSLLLSRKPWDKLHKKKLNLLSIEATWAYLTTDPHVHPSHLTHRGILWSLNNTQNCICMRHGSWKCPCLFCCWGWFAWLVAGPCVWEGGGSANSTKRHFPYRNTGSGRIKTTRNC